MGATKANRTLTPMESLVQFAKAVSKNKAYTPANSIATDSPVELFEKWSSYVKRKHSGNVMCGVRYLPEGGNEIHSAVFLALNVNNLEEGPKWREVNVKVLYRGTKEVIVSEEIATPRQYKGLRGLLNI